MLYLWLKGAHVASVLIFIGGLLAQSLLLAAGRSGAEPVEAVSRWDRRVTAPAMMLAWLSGALVATTGNWFAQHWLWAKLVLVVALTGLHGIQAGKLRRLRKGEQPRSDAALFSTSAAVAIAVTIIAGLAVTKPF